MSLAKEDSYDRSERKERVKRLRKHIPDFAELLAEYVIPRVGWELDNYGWIVRLKDGSVALWETSHGGLYEGDAESLREVIAETEAALESQTKALEILSGELLARAHSTHAKLQP